MKTQSNMNNLIKNGKKEAIFEGKIERILIDCKCCKVFIEAFIQYSYIYTSCEILQSYFQFLVEVTFWFSYTMCVIIRAMTQNVELLFFIEILITKKNSQKKEQVIC